MSVGVTLTGLDGQTVLCMRTCICPCRPEMQMQLDEVPILMHELDLVRLADLTDSLPIKRACTYCGRNTIAEYRIAAVVPAERDLRALVHVRKGSEQAYALIEHGGSADADAAAREIFRSLPDPELRQEVPAVEEVLVQQWGRPLSTHALVRAAFTQFLASGKAARITSWDGCTGYLFARRDEDDLPTVPDVAEALAPVWDDSSKSLLSMSVEEAQGHTGSLIDCLGPAASGLGTAGITCLANMDAFERLTEEALSAINLTWEEDQSGSGARLFRATVNEFQAELSVGDVARSALLYGRTPAEAATLEAQRLAFKLAATSITKQMLRRGIAG